MERQGKKENRFQNVGKSTALEEEGEEVEVKYKETSQAI
jgi:hypothetical protein